VTIFDSTRYDRGHSFFADGSDAYANKGMLIGFHHIPSGREIFFKAAITAFNESYNSDWTSEIVYGRADAILLFKNTERRISLAFNVAASSKSEAYENLSKVGDLAKFLYPYYTSIGDASTIGQSPLIRLKVMNLLSSQKNANDGSTFSNMHDNLSSISPSDGLLGAITSVSINHNLENSEGGSIEAGNGVLLPKLIEINLEFAVIHEHAVGWSDQGFGVGGDTSGASFPYGLAATGSSIQDFTVLEQTYVRPLLRAAADADAAAAVAGEILDEIPPEDAAADEGANINAAANLGSQPGNENMTDAQLIDSFEEVPLTPGPEVISESTSE